MWRVDPVYNKHATIPIKVEKNFCPMRNIITTEKELKRTEGNLAENSLIPNILIQK